MNEAVRIDGYQAKLVGVEIRKTRAERAEDCRMEGLTGMDERTKVICRSRNMLRGMRLAELKESIFGRKSLIGRAKRTIETAWAIVWAITAGKCWIEMGETAGLWEDISDETEH